MNRRRFLEASILAFAMSITVPTAVAVCYDVADTYGQTCGGVVVSPTSHTAAEMVCRFWGLNEGIFTRDSEPACDASNDCGADNGGWDDTQFLYDLGGGQNIFVANWQSDPLIDGCPTVQPGKADKVMFFACSDHTREIGYFATSAALRQYVADGCDDYDFSNFRYGGVRDIALVPIEKPLVVDASRYSVTLRAPVRPVEGFYPDGSAQILPEEAVIGYRIYQQYQPPPPEPRDSDRLRSEWTPVGGTRPYDGINPLLPWPCQPWQHDGYYYFAFTYVLDSGYETEFVGEDSNPVWCRILAEPREPVFKLIQKPAARKESRATPRPAR